MHHTTTARLRRHVGSAALGTVAVLVLLLASCGSTHDPAGTAAPASGNPYGHVHGIHADATTGKVLVAAHNGLFDAGSGTPQRVGPRIDLMGSTTDGDGILYASGHPGPGNTLPNPVGLIQSADGGRTWNALSRAGQSDFHAMTVTDDRILGFDGSLRSTADGATWSTHDAGFEPHALAGSPANTVVLATTEEGVWRSNDRGESWDPPADGPVLVTAAFADADTAVGVAPDGTVYTSADAGLGWTTAGSTGVLPSAVDAGHTKDGTLNIWVADDAGIQLSIDGGASFFPVS